MAAVGTGPVSLSVSVCEPQDGGRERERGAHAHGGFLSALLQGCWRDICSVPTWGAQATQPAAGKGSLGAKRHVPGQSVSGNSWGHLINRVTHSQHLP